MTTKEQCNYIAQLTDKSKKTDLTTGIEYAKEIIKSQNTILKELKTRNQVLTNEVKRLQSNAAKPKEQSEYDKNKEHIKELSKIAHIKEQRKQYTLPNEDTMYQCKFMFITKNMEKAKDILSADSILIAMPNHTPNNYTIKLTTPSNWDTSRQTYKEYLDNQLDHVNHMANITFKYSDKSVLPYANITKNIALLQQQQDELVRALLDELNK
jgi:hypothetical protein